MLTKLWSLSSYKAADLATDRDAVPGPEIVPEYFWSNCVQLTSAVKARSLTGVQTMLPPMTAKLKLALQVPTKPSNATALAQIVALPASP